jgi:hypothetical protein
MLNKQQLLTRLARLAMTVVLTGVAAGSSLAAVQHHHRPAPAAQQKRRHHGASRQTKAANRDVTPPVNGTPQQPPAPGTTSTGSAVLAAPALSSPTLGPAVPTPAAPTLFAPSSVWNQPLASTAALDPASAPMVSGLQAEVTREEGLGIGPWITAGANIYVVGATQPVVPVQLDNPTAWWRVALQSAFTAVPIPDNAQPGSDADAEMTVWQPSTDKLWEFFHMRRLADGWHAGWGGAMDNVAESLGYFNSSSWPGALSVWGATASSLPHAAGVITLADLQKGEIDHALAVNLPYPCQGVYSWPAQRTDGTGTASNCVPEGAHLRLDPGLDLSTLRMPPLALMMARAAQKYGIVVRDQTHWAIGFWIENPTPTGTNPFYNSNGSPSASGPYSGLWPNQIMSYFPWSSLEVLKMTPGSQGTQ